MKTTMRADKYFQKSKKDWKEGDELEVNVYVNNGRKVDNWPKFSM